MNFSAGANLAPLAEEGRSRSRGAESGKAPRRAVSNEVDLNIERKERERERERGPRNPGRKSRGKRADGSSDNEDDLYSRYRSAFVNESDVLRYRERRRRCTLLIKHENLRAPFLRVEARTCDGAMPHVPHASIPPFRGFSAPRARKARSRRNLAFELF